MSTRPRLYSEWWATQYNSGHERDHPWALMRQRTAGLQPCFQRRQNDPYHTSSSQRRLESSLRAEMAPFRPGEGHWGAFLVFHSVVCVAPDLSSSPFPSLCGLVFLLPSQSHNFGSGAGAGGGGSGRRNLGPDSPEKQPWMVLAKTQGSLQNCLGTVMVSLEPEQFLSYHAASSMWA